MFAEWEGGREGEGRRKRAKRKRTIQTEHRVWPSPKLRCSEGERGGEREGARHCQGGRWVGRSVGERGVRNEDIIPGWKYVMRGEERRGGGGGGGGWEREKEREREG